MFLSEGDVRTIAANIRISLTDEELTRMTRDLNDLIESLSPITEYDLSGVEPTYHPIPGLLSIMHKDVIEPELVLKEVFANAPDQQDEQFLIPLILSGGGGR